jgi:diguanylate cyclase (GGDEF)-like protein
MSLSWVAGVERAHNAAQRSRSAFTLAATQLEASMAVEIQRETDLLNAAGAFIKENSRDYETSFRRWVVDADVLNHYAELVSLTAIQPSSAGCPSVTTVGLRLTTRLGALGRAAACRSLPALSRTRDSGRLTPFGLSMPRAPKLYGESLPVYRTRSVPITVEGRRRQLLGWVVITADPHVLLREAAAGFPNLRLTIRTTAVDRLTFSTGPRVRGTAIKNRLSNGTLELISSGSVGPGSILDDGTALVVALGGTALSILVGLVISLLGTSSDRAMRLVEEMTDKLAYRALHDPLTGLPNRALIGDMTSHALARAVRRGAPVAVLLIDVDGFSGFNDKLGPDAGDQVLRTIGDRLRKATRDSDTVARMGSDEFLLLLEAQWPMPDPELVAERILDVLAEPIEVSGIGEIHVTASIGVALGLRETPAELLRNADVALHAAKDGGENSYVTYCDEMHTQLAARQNLQLDLKDAIAHDEMFLVYQPIFNLADGTLRGLEALLRWRHPERGIVPPDQFIPIAEETGAIVEIGRWVTERACRQAAAWQARGVEMVMGVNVSGRQLDDECFPQDVARIFEETGIEPASVVLEITETTLMRDPEAAARRLEELKRGGVRIAIDDFGTGYSSLAYLRLFAVDSIKIDRSFITAIGSSKEGLALVSTLIQLGKRLHLTTLSEGIETQSQLQSLRRAGCDLGQGFLLARPLSAAQIDEMLDNGSLRTAPVASHIPKWAAHAAEADSRGRSRDAVGR